MAVNRLKWLDRVSGVGGDALFLAVGILFLTEKITGWTILYFLILALCFFLPVRFFLSIQSGTIPSTKADYLMMVFNLLFGIVLLIWPNQFMMFVHVFFGWWMLGHGILHLVDFYVCLHDQLPGSLRHLISGILFLILSVFLIIGRNMAIKTEVLSILAGIFFIVYALFGFLEHLLVLLKGFDPARSSFSVTSPILMTAFLPIQFYISIKELKRDTLLKEKRETTPSDLRVYIYLKGKGPEMFGHIDISYKGTIWSYGNHDPRTRRLNGTLGDGVVIRADEIRFLRESIETDHKTIICFGIRLSESQKKTVESRLEQLMERAVPWKCDAQLAHEAGKDMEPYNDYASRVYKETFCDMYKFSSGKFRTYFISSTNCVILADELIRNKDLRLIDLTGLITPGAYLSFLNTEYLKKNTPVISRIFYEKGVNDPVPDIQKTAASV